MKFSKNEGILLSLGGLVSGFVNGLLGAGGGIIIVYLLTKLLHGLASDSRDVFANALCIMLPISVVSCIIYARRGDISVSGFGIFVVPAVVGGIIGGILLNRIKASALKKIFAWLVVWSGVMLMIK